MKFLGRVFWTLVALLFLLEAWLWEHLGPLVARLVALIPFKALKRRLAEAIQRLPPYPSLVLFAVPGLVLLPFKLVALWLLAKGQVFVGGLTFAAAKVVGFGVTAFIFETTKPKLMELAWFARLHDAALRAKTWAKARVEPYTQRIKAAIRLARREGRSRIVRRIALIRARVQAGWKANG